VTSKNIVVLISGNGSNLQAIIDHKARNYEIICVVSDQEEAYGLSRAKWANIPTQAISSNKFSKKEFDALLLKLLIDLNADLIVLAGFMKILSNTFINSFDSKIINLHPSLLPSFQGANAIQQAWDAGVKITGCTIHWVNAQVDSGKIIAQEAVQITKDDTLEILTRRIHDTEHKLLTSVVAELSYSF